MNFARVGTMAQGEPQKVGPLETVPKGLLQRCEVLQIHGARSRERLGYLIKSFVRDCRRLCSRRAVSPVEVPSLVIATTLFTSVRASGYLSCLSSAIARRRMVTGSGCDGNAAIDLRR